MRKLTRTIAVSIGVLSAFVAGPHIALSQESPYFVPGNLVVVVEGCGDYGGTCTAVLNGTGTAGGYGDNQAGPLTLFQYAPTGTSNVTYVNSLVLPQSPSGANVQVSGELGSSSEGTLQLSGGGQYLTLMGYGIDALSFNANPENYGTLINPKGAPNYAALGQTGSLTLANQTATGQTSLAECSDDTTVCYPDGYTPVPRVLALIDPYGNINTSTALYNIFDFNNPRSVYTLDGVTGVWVSGQGSGTDTTGGVFYSPMFAVNNSPVAITGLDSCASKNCTTPTIGQDTRTVQIYNNTLYISVDSTEGSSNNRSFIGTLGTPPATTMYTPTTPPTGDLNGPMELSGFGNTGGTGKVTITTGASSNGNSLNNSTTKVNGVALDLINLSPSNYFFASPSVLYVADTGNPKNNSNGLNDSNDMNNIGDGGLQKWVNSNSEGTGTWSLAYTLYQGLNLVNNGGTTGTTGLYGLAGMVSEDGENVYLYATNATIADLDPTYLYGITDTLANTTPPGASLAFTLLDTAPADSNFKGLSFAPSLPAGSATITTSPSGLTVTAAGTGCVSGTYTSPATLIWTPGSSCTLTVTPPQASAGTEYTVLWQDGTTTTTDSVIAPTTSAVYSATFTTNYELTTTAGTGGSVTPGGYIPAGTNATIAATPNTGYYFVNFTGTTESTSNPLILTMNSPQSITANFAAQIAPTVTFTGAPSTAPESSSFAIAATTNSGATPQITASGSCSLSGSTVTITSPSGTCMLTAVWPAQGMYLGATLTQSTTAQPPAPVITWATPAAITYGTALSGTQLDATAAYDGTKVPGTFTYTPAKGTVLTAGTQTLSVLFTANNSANFSPVTASVTLQVNQATPKITWNKPAAITYGTPLSDTQLDATASVPGSFLYSPGADAVLTGGTQTLSVTFTPTDATDYQSVNATVNITVDKATPTISWTAPASISYGTPLSATQLDATSTLNGSFTYSPAAGAVLAAGAQTLNTTFTPTDTTDYTTAKTSVTIQVTASTPTLSWATPAAITYGAALSNAQLDASATLNGNNVAGTYTYSPTKGTVLGAGLQTLTVVFTPNNTSNYNSATGSVTLQVNPATPQITWLKPGAIEYGTPLSSTQLDATATIPGSFVYSPGAGTVLPEGGNTLSVVFTPTDTTDYAQGTASVTITVKP
jgi:Divergent InlB B-repeat domain